MRIPCPFCGERCSSEFTYTGAASGWRPDPDGTQTPQQVFEAVYLRDNPAGPHEELWYHASGCRSWLKVTRDTRTHEIITVRFAKDTSS